MSNAALLREMIQEILNETSLSREIRDKIRQRREEMGLSQTELGKKIGVSRSAVTRLERGSSTPLPKVLKRLASFLEIPYELIQNSIGTDDSALDKSDKWLTAGGREIAIGRLAKRESPTKNIDFDETVPETLGQLITLRRVELRWSLRLCASKIGIGAAFLGLIEKDQSIPRAAIWKNICSVLNIDPEAIHQYAGDRIEGRHDLLEPEIQRKIGKIVRNRRNELGWGSLDTAQKLGIQAAYYSNIESGKFGLNTKAKNALFSLMGISHSVLSGNEQAVNNAFDALQTLEKQEPIHTSSEEPAPNSPKWHPADPDFNPIDDLDPEDFIKVWRASSSVDDAADMLGISRIDVIAMAKMLRAKGEI